MDVNKVIILGHVSQEPEQQTINDSMTVTRFNVATNHVWTDTQTAERQERVLFHSVIAWNKLATTVKRYVHKGDRIYIEGRIEYRSFEGKDGKKRYYTNIIAQNLVMLSSKHKSNEEAANTVPEDISIDEVPFEE